MSSLRGPIKNAVRRRRLRLGGLAVAVLALGLLLWARLILVTGHPRTAIAKPEPAKAPAAVKPAAPAAHR